jgi:hypothetical protein
MSNDRSVKLDLNHPAFQKSLLELDKSERNRVLDTLKKLLKVSWHQVYSDPGLKWEKITSVTLPPGVDAVYSLRITQSRRATAVRSDDFLRLLTVAPDHDATYGKK